MRQRRLRHVEITVDVRLERLVPLRFSDVFDTFLMLLKGSVVDQNVQLAKLVDRLLHQLLANFRIAYITRERDRALPLGFNRALGLFGVALLFLQKRKRDVRAFAREEHCDSASDTRITTSDERDFLFQFSSAVVQRRFVPWPGF